MRGVGVAECIELLLALIVVSLDGPTAEDEAPGAVRSPRATVANDPSAEAQQ
jgi:hypothetical protein